MTTTDTTVAPTLSAADGFRLRGHQVTRVEALSDVVFAFALTLLGVSLGVPRTFDQLLETMRDFPAFAICFAILIRLWHDHYRFFRRYGLQDGTTIFLNSVLLFIVILFVYALKFLVSLWVTVLTT
ncbi:MAG: TMEM175 family protein, partial [Candidatus Binatus sp.]